MITPAWASDSAFWIWRLGKGKRRAFRGSMMGRFGRRCRLEDSEGLFDAARFRLRGLGTRRFVL